MGQATPTPETSPTGEIAAATGPGEHRPIRRSGVGRWAERAGRLVAAAGVLVVLFLAYQLWGTGLSTARAQARLRAELVGELPHAPGATEAARPGPAHAGAARPSGYADGPPQAAPPPTTPAPGQPVGTIDIPSIGLDMVVVEGVGAADLAMGPGHYPGTPLPGEAGNAAIAGHRTTYLHPFYDLTAVADGDAIVVTTPQGVFTYVARDQATVAPTDVTVVGPTASPTLTLTTCNPRYSAATRLVLRATLARAVLFGRHLVPLTSPRAMGRSVPGRPTPTQRGPLGKARPGLAGGTAPPGVASAAGWGLAVAAVVLVAWRVRRRRPSGRRWPVYLAAGAAAFVLLFFFFGAVSPFLPASV